MKSLQQIRATLCRQWYNNATRCERLLSPESWPIKSSLGKPTAREFSEHGAKVKKHINDCKNIKIGELRWEAVSYRAGEQAIQIPTYWILNNPSDWIAATENQDIVEEFHTLEYLVKNSEEIFRQFLISQRKFWAGKNKEEILNVVQLAAQLQAGCAQGRPLRLLSEYGVDTKFIERNASLLTCLLDERFDGEASQRGLTHFLGAHDENNHWLLLAPLAENIFPFKRLRVSTQDLAQTTLPFANILIVENEQCVHLLPEIPNTLAILGAGLNLQWLRSSVFQNKHIAYWGDIDTWGLLMLSRARDYCPAIRPILMNLETFQQFAANNAVPELTTVDTTPPYLSDSEQQLYYHLLQQERGRLEQEFIPLECVKRELVNWVEALKC